MKTQRELLELAAKAADIPCDKNGPYVERQEWQQWIGEPGHYETVRVNWNPLTDDGDALRLAVKLGIERIFVLRLGPNGVCVDGVKEPQTVPVFEHSVYRVAFDPYASTRLAITRAAAAIGEAMP